MGKLPAGLWREGGGGGNATEQSVFQGGNAALRPTRITLAKQLPLTPKGKELVEQYTAGDGEFGGETGAPGDDPRYHTPPCGPVSPALGGEVEIVQNPKRLLVVYTGNWQVGWRHSCGRYRQDQDSTRTHD